eukprot:gene12994-biopygen7322
MTGLATRLYESLSPAPKKTRASVDDGEGSEDFELEAINSRDRDRDDSRIDSGPSPRPNAQEELQIGQLILAKEDRKGEFTEAKILKIDRRWGVQVEWAESGTLKWLRKDLWPQRLKESCRVTESPAVEERA